MTKSQLRQTIIYILWILTALIGGLQMFHMRVELLTTHGADLIAPALLYFITRDGKSLIRYFGARPDKPWLIGIVVMILCVGWELLQKAHVIPGVFDVFDLVAYGAGILGALLLDRFLTNN